MINDKQSNLQLAQRVTQSLEKYPSAFEESELGYQVAYVLHHTANCYAKTKQYDSAKELYQKLLEKYYTIKGVEERQKQIDIATIHRNLGMIAQESRDFKQAQQYHQQALEIKIEYGDRYLQAHTYYNLGMVAEALEQPESAKTNYLKALQFFAEFNNEYGLDISLRNLARFYQVTKDESLLAAVTSILGATVEEIRSFCLKVIPKLLQN